jgi:ABC-type branched-subunit amino acid transport system substrate-binding protein
MGHGSLTTNRAALAVLAAVALLAAGCGRAGSGSGSATTPSPSGAAQAAPGSFGDLKDVCHPGGATGATDQGVTSSQITVGVLSDVGFTKDPQLLDLARVFTSWCNAAGGIDGRKLVADIHDTQLFNVVQAMTKACAADFALAGGSAAFDGLAVKARLSCLLPEFPAQTVMQQNQGAGLQVYPITYGYSYSPFAGYFSWLLKQAYPGSASSVGIFYGNASVAQISAAEAAEALRGEGATMTFNESFPPVGVSDWTPYAEAIKNKGVRGLVFYGEPQQLAALELMLTNIGYKLDWIDTDPNAYGSVFIQLAGRALSFQHNYANIDAVYPTEMAADNPATQQVLSLYQKYAPGRPVMLQALQGFSAWLVFAVSAEACGSDLTRKCLYEAALRQTGWTGGGLTASVDLARPDSPPTCFDAEEATPNGWRPASFGANHGPYRCGIPVYKYKVNYGQPVTLADVGKSLSDLK